MQCAFWQKVFRPLWPFNQHDPFAGLVPRQFMQRIRPVQTPQVIMINCSFGRLVRLNKRETGARHLHLRVLRQMAQESAGEGTFPRSQTTRKRKAVSGATTVGNQGRQSFGRKLVIKAYLHATNVDPTALCQQGRSEPVQRPPFRRRSIHRAMTASS